jgi:hypothetical protein
LKQAPKQWYENFDKVILSNEFKIIEVDKYIYVRNTYKNYVIVCPYVDDIKWAIMIIWSNISRKFYLISLTWMSWVLYMSYYE